MKLFISYRSLDSAKVDTIVSRLRNMQSLEGIPKFEPWQDKYDIPDGHDWWESIVDAIVDCNVFVFMVSRESAQNTNCRAELSYARRRNRPILPIVLEGEYLYNSTTGKNDIDYWDDLPDELNDIGAQFLFYEGTSFVQRMTQAVKLYQQEPQRWRDISAERPRDPRLTADETNNSDVLYDEACDYAWRMEFATAEKLFQKLINRNTQFANEAETWITIIRDYEKLIRYSKRKNLHYKMVESWKAYKSKFPLPYLESFDPRNLKGIIQNQIPSLSEIKSIPSSLTHDESIKLQTLEQSSKNARSLSSAQQRVLTRGIQEFIKNVEVLEREMAFQENTSDTIVTPEEPIQTSSFQENQIHQLDYNYPFDWLRLLYWTLIKPTQLAHHRELYGDEAEKPTASWLSATMMYVPVLIIFFLPLAIKTSWAQTFFETTFVSPNLVLLCSVGIWLILGVLGYDHSDIVDNIAWTIVTVAMYVVIGMIAIIVVLSIWGIVEGFVAVGIAVIITGSVATILAVRIARGVALTVKNVINVSLENQKASVWNYLIAFLLFLSYMAILAVGIFNIISN